MDENLKAIELLMQNAYDYGKTGFEIAKLKSVEKISDIASSLIPHTVVFLLIASFLFFLNLGLALWLGDILGKTFYGFIIVGGFYGICGFVLHFFMNKWFKRVVGDYFVKMLLN